MSDKSWEPAKLDAEQLLFLCVDGRTLGRQSRFCGDQARFYNSLENFWVSSSRTRRWTNYTRPEPTEILIFSLSSFLTSCFLTLRGFLPSLYGAG